MTRPWYYGWNDGDPQATGPDALELCPACKGDGQVRGHDCKRCNGTGGVEMTEECDEQA